MRYSAAATFAFLWVPSISKDALAFAPTHTHTSGICLSHDVSSARQTLRSPIVVSMSKGKGKKKLSVADVIAGGSKKVEQNGPGEVNASDNFSEDLLADMQSCLQKLEKRAKCGPGTLDSAEVSDFEAAMERIVADMDSKLQQGASSLTAAASATATASSIAGPSGTGSSAGKGFAPTPASSAASPPLPPLPARPSAATPDEADPFVVADISLDDGPAYTGTFGMAQETRSTYVIPGMEEMTGEEYRKALQKSVSDRQEERRKARSGVVGNRAAHSYLDDLGWGGASSSLAAATAIPTDDVKKSGSDNSDSVTEIAKSHNHYPFNPRNKSDNAIFSNQKLSPPPKTTDRSKHKYSKPDPVVHHGSHRKLPEFEDRVVDGNVTDTSLDEGPVYTGEGGLGIAKGTRNTYVIPGMEEMTGEEYRRALQKSVSDRQEERRKARGGVVGNRAAHSYLDDLGWGGASSSLAADSGEE